MQETNEPLSPSDNEIPKKHRLKLYQVNILFVYHLVLSVVLAYLIYNVWPPQPWPGDTSPASSRIEATATLNSGSLVPGDGVSQNSPSSLPSPKAPDHVEQSYPPKFRVFGMDFQPTLESRLILLVLLVGAMGSYVHAATSFVDYLGNRAFISSWIWWYLLKPFVGMLLALIFYFVFRGGFITAGFNAAGESATNFINPFGIASLAALVGMFSKVATDKLNEVFSTLFRPAPGQGDARRSDKLIPLTLLSIRPRKGRTTGGLPVTLTGGGFNGGVKVLFGKKAATAVELIDASTLKAVTPAHEPGTVTVSVISIDNRKAVLEDGFSFEEAEANGKP